MLRPVSTKNRVLMNNLEVLRSDSDDAMKPWEEVSYDNDNDGNDDQQQSNI